MAGTHDNISMVLLCFLFLATVPLLTSSSVLRTLHHASENDGSLRFLVIGDWGRRGDYNQSLVAAQMGRIAAEMRTEFVVSTGDNFYDNGLEGEADPAFLQSFTNVYTAPSLQTKWFLVLGNHDYRGDVLAQLAPSLRQIDRRWICMRSFIVNTEIAELFFVDTTPFVEDYVTGRDGHTYDWRGITPVKNYTSHLLEELELALKRSNASWKIVVGHHAIRSVGHHGDTTELIDQLLPILQANNVDLYLNGHDHCLERISDAKSPLQFMTSGAGSKAWRGDVKNMNEEGLKFFYDGQGFMSLHLTQTDARATFYDVFGRVLHTWHRSKELHTDF